MIDEETARQRVVSAADRLFYARGVHSVGMDAVRAEAGVSLKRMYALFPSKDELVVAVLARRSAEWDAGIAAAAAQATTARERVLAIFDFLDAWFRTSGFRGCAFVNAFGELGATSPQVAEAVRAQKESFRAYVSDQVREAGAPDAVADQIVLLAEGAQVGAAVLGDPGLASRARDAAAGLLDAAGVR